MPGGAVLHDRPARNDQKRNLLMKPVKRNATRQIEMIRESITRVTTRHPQHGYQPYFIRPEVAWKYFDESLKAQLIDHEDGTYSILDGSVWYRLYTI